MTIITSLVTTVKRERLHHSHIHSICFFRYKYHFERNATTVYFPPRRKLSKKMGVAIALTKRKISKATISE